MQIKRFSEIDLDDDLLFDTIAQLNKDLSISLDSELRWNDDVPNPYNAFRTDVKAFMLRLLNQPKSKLQATLYRVDLAEGKVQKIWAYDEETRANKLAEMVLNRVLQKVLTRRLYKGNDGR